MKKVVPAYAMKAYTRSRGMAPPILYLGAKLSLLVKITPRPLYPVKPRYILNRRLNNILLLIIYNEKKSHSPSCTKMGRQIKMQLAVLFNNLSINEM